MTFDNLILWVYSGSVIFAFWPALTLVTSYERWSEIRDRLSIAHIIGVLFLTFMPVFNSTIVLTSVFMFIVENNLVKRFFNYRPFKVKK